MNSEMSLLEGESCSYSLAHWEPNSKASSCKSSQTDVYTQENMTLTFQAMKLTASTIVG